MAQLILMRLLRLEQRKQESEQSLVMVLAGAEPEHSKLEYHVPVPSYAIPEFEVKLQWHLSGSKPPGSLLSDLQHSTGIHLRRVVVTKAEGQAVEAEVHTLSEFSESAVFSAPLHSAVLYALLYNLPVLVDIDLTHELSPTSPHHSILNLISCRIAIEEGITPELFFADNSGAEVALQEQSEEILTELLTLAVEKENYEWAQYIQTHLNDEKEKGTE